MLVIACTRLAIRALDIEVEPGVCLEYPEGTGLDSLLAVGAVAPADEGATAAYTVPAPPAAPVVEPAIIAPTPELISSPDVDLDPLPIRRTAMDVPTETPVDVPTETPVDVPTDTFIDAPAA